MFVALDPLCAGIHLMSTWLFSPSLLSSSTATRGFELYLGVVKNYNCSLACMRWDEVLTTENISA